MKIVCIENPSVDGATQILKGIEVGKTYEGNLIFHFDNGKNDWKSNYFNIEGFSEVEWFPTKYFTTLDEWRETQLNKLKI
jgi:hypothetical protein